MENVSFILNGREITAEYEGRMTLLKYLRNVECMKGSKEGCSTGHCGACSVLIDGILARSCVTVLKTLAGKSVETIENLPNDTMLQVIQRSFLDAGAVQCGFCTPGMIMAAKALLCKTVLYRLCEDHRGREARRGASARRGRAAFGRAGERPDRDCNRQGTDRPGDRGSLRRAERLGRGRPCQNRRNAQILRRLRGR